MATEEQARAAKQLLVEEFGHLDLWRGGIGLANDPDDPNDHVVVVYVRSKADKEVLPNEKAGVKILVSVTGHARARLA